MKQKKHKGADNAGKSPPTRGRGLKLCRDNGFLARRNVAPHAGAWIETRTCRTTSVGHTVAPHAGAWIETMPAK